LPRLQTLQRREVAQHRYAHGADPYSVSEDDNLSEDEFQLMQGNRFLTIRDGMQGMELALRTPLTDAARDALVSSWRRLSLRVRTLRLVSFPLTNS
jgi:hypothetical protein